MENIFSRHCGSRPIEAINKSLESMGVPLSDQDLYLVAVLLLPATLTGSSLLAVAAS